MAYLLLLNTAYRSSDKLRITNVIKGEFKKLEDLNDEDVLLTYGTSLEVFYNEFNWMSEMDDDLFTYSWKLAPLPRLEWYKALEDSELKDEALRNKAIMEGLINDDESSNDGWRKWESHEITYHDHDETEYENETHDERQEVCETHELPVCNIRKFEMIKYSFGQDEEYVAIKEDEYDDLARTSNDACRAYQEIFRMMDEGWMVTRAKTSMNEKKSMSWLKYYKSGGVGVLKLQGDCST
ncbi:hypothetical protein Tco_0787777 [Tanacetum coccineum]